MTKKSTVNKVPVSGSNLRLPNNTTTTMCKTAMKMSRDMTRIQGTRNSLWSFLKPIKTKSDENVPNNPQPSEVMLKYTFAVARERNKLKPRNNTKRPLLGSSKLTRRDPQKRFARRLVNLPRQVFSLLVEVERHWNAWYGKIDLRKHKQMVCTVGAAVMCRLLYF